MAHNFDFVSRGAKARSRARSQLPLEVAMAQQARKTAYRTLMKKSLKPQKNYGTGPNDLSPKDRMIHKSRYKKAWHKATGQGNYGGYDKWGRSQ
tara:strand:- start:224 stop:505 length:282 start_codon:yes stop_codon:yes gene_type:complete